MSSPRDWNDFLQTSHEKLADTPGVGSAVTFSREDPVLDLPKDELIDISCGRGTHNERNPWEAITPEDCPMPSTLSSVKIAQ